MLLSPLIFRLKPVYSRIHRYNRARDCRITSAHFVLALWWPHGKRVASDGDSENLSSKKPPKNTGKAVKVGVEERFSFDIGEDFESLKKGECPANTARSTEWAMKNFEMWRIARNLC